jgi:hypothetical protein
MQKKVELQMETTCLPRCNGGLYRMGYEAANLSIDECYYEEMQLSQITGSTNDVASKEDASKNSYGPMG